MTPKESSTSSGSPARERTSAARPADDVGATARLFARCRYDNVPVSSRPTKSDPPNGQPFADGFGTNGALAAS